jgi:hypothetical protein
MKKVILHLCADIGSDSRYFDLDPDFEVIKVGEAIGVENFSYAGDVHGYERENIVFITQYGGHTRVIAR